MGAEEQSWWRRLLARLFGGGAHTEVNWEILQSNPDSRTTATTYTQGRAATVVQERPAVVPPVMPSFITQHPAAIVMQEERQQQAVALTLEPPSAAPLIQTRNPPGVTAAPADYTYALRDDFLSRAEQSFFHVLRDAVATEYLIFPKVGLADLVYPPRQEGQFGAWQRINRKHVDFVLCDPLTLRPRAALELDDRSHRRPDRLERDAFVEQVFADASLPLIRIPAQRTYHRQTIATLVAEAVAPQRVAVAAAPVAATTAEVKTCDRCGGEMKVRTAAQGAHRGEQFWGCTNYPKCRNIVKIAGESLRQVSA